MRILLISAGTLFVLGFLKLLIFFMNSWALEGNARNVQPFPFFEGLKRPFVVLSWESPDATTADVLWADVFRKDEDETLWVKSDKDPVLLKEFLNTHPDKKVILNITQNKFNIHLHLEAVVIEAKAQDRLLIQSDYNPVITSTKGRLPEMVYGSTPADLTRLRTYQTFGLLGFANLPGDAFVMPLKYRTVTTLDPELAVVLQKFLKAKIILGPLTTKDEVEQALRLDADGLVLTDRSLYP